MFDRLDAAFALATDRFVLRRPRMDDAQVLAALANDRTIAENTATIPHPYGLKDAEDYIQKAQVTTTAAPFVVIRRDDQALIGAGAIALRPQDEAPEIGYWIGEPYRGQGAATETAHALVDLAFEQLALTRLVARCRVTNVASRNVLEKCGFQWCGTGLEGSVGFRGAFPVDRFRLERGVWASLRAWRAARTGAYDEALLVAAK
ncbi:N-acetyltransferase [Agaricicola taiwanensis]|uniref:N-acetyltransferase n=1 Tax=Agaricicola taiwanensis TaxID=591372 RepID=A0A8J2VCY1_9RHOB|nr:GNAT family N-acetyltransferase [Agaricicola taiwanensis]GGE26897.1 N-acetyltransferase [Agaricicola taiwanensis]